MAQESKNFIAKLLPKRSAEQQPRQLSPLLVWAVVFCDIGTSVYYVPGILYSQVNSLAPILVLGTTIGFLLLSTKYIEICWRNPEGGGVVTITTKAFTPVWGCLGGMFITVDYFLTSAISSVSGIHYLSSIFTSLEDAILPLTVATLILLACINIIGIRESAIISLVMALAAILVDFVVIGLSAFRMSAEQWKTVLQHLQLHEKVSFSHLLTGFAGAWLAFSGLESISQLSPAMRAPLKTTSRRGMGLVVLTILLTSPVLTLFSVALLSPQVKKTETEHFISALGELWGRLPVKLAVVCTASALLLFAANTAIIGSYHVFLALAERGFLPKIITARNRYFGTPHYAIGVATVVPILVVLFTQGDLTRLGNMYAFGLLGAFFLSSLSLDVIRWRRRRRGWGFWIGIITTLVVLAAWSINLVTKGEATIFGGTLVAIGMVITFLTQQGVFSDIFYKVPTVARVAQQRISEAERGTEDKATVISLSQAKELVSLYPSHTLVALRGPNRGLLVEAIIREKGLGGFALYALYVEERPGLFVGGAAQEPNPDGIQTLQFAARIAEEHGITMVPVWTVSYNAAEAIARAAEMLKVDTVMVGVSRRSAIYHLLRGHVINGLIRRLPKDCRLMLHSG